MAVVMKILRCNLDSKIRNPCRITTKNRFRARLRFVRTQDGRIKFLNKRKREDEESMETRSGAAAPSGDGAKNVGSRWTGGRNNRNPKTSGVDASAVNRMLGRQYKAKRAQGDVKSRVRLIHTPTSHSVDMLLATCTNPPV
ncbi:hypothetical protein BASA81_008975 [Batrachochytrium salamandrivorans]|nr:hypothetical protein BASA81_008975 [Batrachochytrium salamandrivorans]